MSLIIFDISNFVFESPAVTKRVLELAGVVVGKIFETTVYRWGVLEGQTAGDNGIEQAMFDLADIVHEGDRK